MKTVYLKMLAVTLACTLLLLSLVSCDILLGGGDTECQHRDADDSLTCDKCGVEFADAKDLEEEPECQHRDADDNSVCDECGEEYSGEKDLVDDEPACKHADANSDSACDECGEGYTEGVSYARVGDSAEVTGYRGGATAVVISGVYDGVPVTKIASAAFANCTSLESLTIPDSVVSIGERAFDGCTGLADLFISDIAAWCAVSFASLSANPLYYAENFYVVEGEQSAPIEELVIPNGVTVISNYSFANYDGLERLEVPSSVTRVGNSAFESCDNLALVTIGDGAVAIGDRAFYGCIKLNNPALGGATSIGNSAFRGCTGLISVVIPDSVVGIGEHVFSDCSALAAVALGDGLIEIGAGAFSRCESLVSITIPRRVVSVGPAAFYLCTGLMSVTFGNVGGWKICDPDGENAVSIFSSELEDAADAASLLKGTYVNKCWAQN